MLVYLDNAATTRVYPEAAQAAYDVMTQAYGNPSSQYRLGTEAAARLKRDRTTVAGALGCKPDELYFTSCGTEGDNWALTIGAVLGRRWGKHIITSAVEHAAVIQSAKVLEEQGYEVTYLKPDKAGRIDLADLEAALRPDTVLVSLMLVNNETGVTFPVAEAAKAIHRAKAPALLHTDAVQAFLKVPFSPKALGADLVTVSGHKIGAPKGIGALYIRSGLKAPSFLRGGKQESGLRAGTEATAQIAAFAVACEIRKAGLQKNFSHMTELKAYTLEHLTQSVPGLVVVSAGDAPHICAVSLPGYPSEMLVRDLSDRDICVSSGSACHKGKPSHVYEAMHLDPRINQGVLRISFAPENTRADADALCRALVDIQRERVPAAY